MIIFFSYNGLLNASGKKPRQWKLCNKFGYYIKNYQHLIFPPFILITDLLVLGKVDTPHPRITFMHNQLQKVEIIAQINYT